MSSSPCSITSRTTSSRAPSHRAVLSITVSSESRTFQQSRDSWRPHPSVADAHAAVCPRFNAKGQHRRHRDRPTLPANGHQFGVCAHTSHWHAVRTPRRAAPPDLHAAPRVPAVGGLSCPRQFLSRAHIGSRVLRPLVAVRVCPVADGDNRARDRFEPRRGSGPERMERARAVAFVPRAQRRRVDEDARAMQCQDMLTMHMRQHKLTGWQLQSTWRSARPARIPVSAFDRSVRSGTCSSSLRSCRSRTRVHGDGRGKRSRTSSA